MPHDCVLLQRTIATRVVRALNFLLPVRFFLCSNARFRRPNRARAQEVFQRAAKVGALHASRKRLPLCKDTQSAFYNLGVCLRDNVGAPLRRDGTYRYDMTALEIDEARACAQSALHQKLSFFVENSQPAVTVCMGAACFTNRNGTNLKRLGLIGWHERKSGARLRENALEQELSSSNLISALSL